MSGVHNATWATMLRRHYHAHVKQYLVWRCVVPIALNSWTLEATVLLYFATVSARYTDKTISGMLSPDWSSAQLVWPTPSCFSYPKPLHDLLTYSYSPRRLLPVCLQISQQLMISLFEARFVEAFYTKPHAKVPEPLKQALLGIARPSTAQSAKPCA